MSTCFSVAFYKGRQEDLGLLQAGKASKIKEVVVSESCILHLIQSVATYIGRGLELFKTSFLPERSNMESR